jgi:hypothetical protein
MKNLVPKAKVNWLVFSSFIDNKKPGFGAIRLSRDLYWK